MSTIISQTTFLVAATVGVALFALVPTCVYRYIEPRSRVRWATAGDRPDTRRAPLAVRMSVWWALACAQLALVCLAAALACGVLLYVQLRLGVRWPMGLLGSGALAIGAIAQGAIAAQLVPSSLGLLLKDARVRSRIRSGATRQFVLSGLLIGGDAVFSTAWNTWALLLPKLLHPWLRAALLWSALRPVQVVALACVVAVGLLTASSARFLSNDSRSEAP